MRFIFTFILFTLMLLGLIFPQALLKTAYVALTVQILFIATSAFFNKRETEKKPWLTFIFILILSLLAGILLGLLVFNLEFSKCLILAGLFTGVMNFLTDLYISSKA